MHFVTYIGRISNKTNLKCRWRNPVAVSILYHRYRSFYFDATVKFVTVILSTVGFPLVSTDQFSTGNLAALVFML